MISNLTINFIGAGNVGKTLAKLIVKHKTGKILGICNKSVASSTKAAKFIGQGQVYNNINELPTADITFITTPDTVIQQCCEELCQSANINLKSTIIHCSGSLTSEILQPAKLLGSNIASIHPMHSFADPKTSVEQFPGTYCTIEGDSEALIIIRKIFLDFGSIIFEIDKTNKILYHATGVFAANYLVTLYEIATNCLRNSGVEDSLASQMILKLMTDTLNNLHMHPAKNSLTGPIKRGDSVTILNHLQALKELNLSEIYCALGFFTLDLAKLPKNKEDEIKAILSKELLETKQG